MAATTRYEKQLLGMEQHELDSLHASQAQKAEATREAEKATEELKKHPEVAGDRFGYFVVILNIFTY